MLRVRHLGTVGYDEAVDLQRAVARHGRDDYLLLLEHRDVYTMGVRTDPAHLLVDPSTVGAELATSDRGGDVTYHGPGQLVVYPVRTIADDPGAGRQHVNQLEQIVIDALVDLGVRKPVGRLEGYPGVWIDPGGDQPRKVAAVGVRAVRLPWSGPDRPQGWRKRTLHGVAINVDCNLAMFGHIVPCGLTRPVTSLRAEGLDCTVEDLARSVTDRSLLVWSGDGTGSDDQAVVGRRDQRTPPGAVPVILHSSERAPWRRLRKAGVDPDGGLPLRSPKPPWLRVKAQMGDPYLRLGRTIRDLGLVTVCEEAGCPNIFECWHQGTATFMVNGSRCTRACGFCLVDTRHPLPLDPEEPERVAEAVARMELDHAVITCVARDDLSDGGAGGIVATVEAIRRRRPQALVEVLVSDCKGDRPSLDRLIEVQPDVFNHNLETVARLQQAVRPSAGYARSLGVLARAAEAGLVTKSGLMVGLGESPEEVRGALADMAAVGVRIATIGQYLRPSARHLPVARWWLPQELDELADWGQQVGLAHVEASPLTRSSYHAHQAARAGMAAPSVVGQRQPVTDPQVGRAVEAQMVATSMGSADLAAK